MAHLTASVKASRVRRNSHFTAQDNHDQRNVWPPFEYLRLDQLEL